MHIKNFLGFAVLACVLFGCTGESERAWFNEYGTMTAGTPFQMQYGGYYGNYGNDASYTAPKRIAVLLPTSGPNAATGRAIRTSVETATLQRGAPNVTVSFYDTARNPAAAINQALDTNPNIIIGPLFSENARMLRNVKPNDLPVLSFTTDAESIGDGVMSVSLMPSNSIEVIIKEMQADGATGAIIVAPRTKSGELMAGAAYTTANTYRIPINGIFYYDEHNSESIKNAMLAASMNAARTATNNRARAILSDILSREKLSASERSSINRQLNNLNKKDTLGDLPYNAVLFLGSGEDTKSLASFLRYYGVGAHDVRFYGTALWDGSDIASDITMTGAKFATLAPISESFSGLYERVAGTTPSRMATFGYDATNLALGMLTSSKSDAAYLLDPSGYVGIDGLFRLKPTGESERALRIVELDGAGNVRDIRPAPTNFITPIYNIEQHRVSPAAAMELRTRGVNPLDYIKIPERLRRNYTAKTYGTNMSAPAPVAQENIVTILPEDDREIINNPEFTPVNIETVGRTYIDSVEITE